MGLAAVACKAERSSDEMFLVAARTLALPFHPKLTEDQVDEVCTELKALL